MRELHPHNSLHKRMVFSISGPGIWELLEYMPLNSNLKKITANVERSMIDLDISWPGAQDNNMKTWDSYGNMYWPRNMS
ncbi:MAG: hypothetical protein CM1200mP15_15000 [Dehalococcoidia bacterium]|nr:MAG: hypothetical protein CM1200mP15_15000 [Dehalococcoidia bacterium]